MKYLYYLTILIGVAVFFSLSTQQVSARYVDTYSNAYVTTGSTRYVWPDRTVKYADSWTRTGSNYQASYRTKSTYYPSYPKTYRNSDAGYGNNQGYRQYTYENPRYTYSGRPTHYYRVYRQDYRW